MTSYASIPDQRVVELIERAARERRIAAALEHDARFCWTAAIRQEVQERVARHIAKAEDYERQAKALQVPT